MFPAVTPPDKVDATRVRVTQACDQCRLARRKCDSSTPTCGPCTRGKTACSREQAPKRRGKPTGYIWTLEVILALLLDEEPAKGEVIRQFVSARDSERQQRFSVYNEPVTARLHAAWRESETLRDIQDMLAGEDPPLVNYTTRRGGFDLRKSGPEAAGEDEGDKQNQWPLL